LDGFIFLETFLRNMWQHFLWEAAGAVAIFVEAYLATGPVWLRNCGVDI
jgi:hypothetical protein